VEAKMQKLKIPVEPNNSFNDVQVLELTTLPDQNGTNEQVLSIHFGGELSNLTDQNDYFTVGEIKKSGMYIIGAGWSSNILDENVLTDYNL
jgi:hypothetical protein